MGTKTPDIRWLIRRDMPEVLAVARRVYVASIIVFASALAVFVAALVVGAR